MYKLTLTTPEGSQQPIVDQQGLHILTTVPNDGHCVKFRESIQQQFDGRGQVSWEEVK